MSPKNKFPIDIDNRESKKSVVQRFMSSEENMLAEPERRQSSLRESDKGSGIPEGVGENLTDGENEAVVRQKIRKPIKGDKPQKERVQRQKEKSNPFVQAKPKFSDEKSEKDKESREVEKKGSFDENESPENKTSEISENENREFPKNPLPDAGENFSPKFPPHIEIKKKKEFIDEVVFEEVEEIEESDNPEENLSELSELSETAELPETEFKSNTESELEPEIKPESEPEPEIESEPEIDLSSLLPHKQSRIDELIKQNSENYSSSTITVEETEQIISRTVIKKVLKRAYDFDNKEIAHYLEILEKNDAKTKYYFKNTWEDTVVEEVEATLKRAKNICKCDRCFANICAIALNALKPHYVTTAMDELYDRVSLLDFEKQMLISSEVFKAIDVVRSNPTHD